MTDLNELLIKVEAAEDFDRDLDREIGFALDGWEMSGDADNLIYIPSEASYYPDHPGSMYPAFTESLDAVLALAERLLPSGDGWAYSLVHDYGGLWRCHINVAPEEAGWPRQGLNADADADNMCLAILAALLKALLQRTPN